MAPNKTRILAVGLTAVGVAVLALYYVASNRTHQPLPEELSDNDRPISFNNARATVAENDFDQAQSDQTGQLQGQIVSLQSTITSLQQQLNQLKTDRLSAANEEPATTITPAPAHTDEDASAGQQNENQIFLQLESSFAAQTIDRDWSDTAKRRIETALNDEQTRALNIDSVDCRSSICKLEMNQMNSDSEEAFRGPFREQITDVFGAGMVRQDESGKTIVFLAKDAETFQSMLSAPQ